MCANSQVAYIKFEKNIIYNEIALSRDEKNILLVQVYSGIICSVMNLQNDKKSNYVLSKF